MILWVQRAADWGDYDEKSTKFIMTIETRVIFNNKKKLKTLSILLHIYLIIVTYLRSCIIVPSITFIIDKCNIDILLLYNIMVLR